MNLFSAVLIVFFIINIGRIVYNYFYPKPATIHKLDTEESQTSTLTSPSHPLTKQDVIDAVVQQIEKSLFPDIPNVFASIKDNEQLSELLDKINTAFTNHISSTQSSFIDDATSTSQAKAELINEIYKATNPGEQEDEDQVESAQKPKTPVEI